MVINIRLTDVRRVEPDSDSMGRSWYGYNSNCSDTELWAHNRGEYGFAKDRIEQERFATMSHRGQIVLVPHCVTHAGSRSRTTNEVSWRRR